MKLKAGIIGIGKLGSIHTRIYKEIKDIEKVYLVDIDKQKLRGWDDPCFTEYRKLSDKVDLVSIATPVSTHFKISKFFLERKIPVLVEKPMVNLISQANQLLSLAKKNKTLLFVGHVERYNPAYLAAKRIITYPQFIECHRLSPYPYRSLDTSVVLDVMIHDLDIVLDIVEDEIKDIKAVGVKVFSDYEDIANVRISFKHGCIANLTASRVSQKRLRKFRVFSSHLYLSLDYANQRVEVFKKKKQKIIRRLLNIKPDEPLKREIKHFVQLVKKREFSCEYGKKAKRALALSLRIERLLKRKNGRKKT